MKKCTKCRGIKPLDEFYHKSLQKKSRAKFIGPEHVGDSFPKCIDCTREYNRAKAKEHTLKRSKSREKYNKAWSENPIGLSLKREAAYTQPDPHLTSIRHILKKSATPPWLTEQHLQDIRDVYTHAKECGLLTGDSYHVDHIVPIKGKTVCGLHVPWNLQVLPAEVNISKKNTYNDWQD